LAPINSLNLANKKRQQNSKKHHKLFTGLKITAQLNYISLIMNSG
jgi:hypothetical protein